MVNGIGSDSEVSVQASRRWSQFSSVQAVRDVGHVHAVLGTGSVWIVLGSSSNPDLGMAILRHGSRSRPLGSQPCPSDLGSQILAMSKRLWILNLTRQSWVLAPTGHFWVLAPFKQSGVLGFSPNQAFSTLTERSWIPASSGFGFKPHPNSLSFKPWLGNPRFLPYLSSSWSRSHPDGPSFLALSKQFGVPALSGAVPSSNLYQVVLVLRPWLGNPWCRPLQVGPVVLAYPGNPWSRPWPGGPWFQILSGGLRFWPSSYSHVFQTHMDDSKFRLSSYYLVS